MTDTQKSLMYRLVLITLAVLAAYGNILNHGFVWDDFDIIVNNPLLEKLGNIPQFFLTEDKVVAATGYYRPITYVSFALDRAIWGLNPVGFNITNLVLQILVSLFFFAVIRAIFKKEQLALVAALIFALHPLAVETVNFHAGGRNTLLSALFTLMSLFFYLREKRAASVACFTLAIFSKEFALLLPMVFLFYEVRLQRKKVRFTDYLPYLIPVLCYLTLRSFAIQKANFLETIRFSSQLWLTPYLAVRYLLNMIFPFQLKVMYDEQTSVTVCAICLVLVIFLISALFWVRKRDEVVFADYWFLLFLLPVVNIIPIVSNTLIADRYAYFSLMGFALGLATLICKLNGPVRTACVVILCAAFFLVDFRQNGVWKNEATLFTRMAQDAPQMSIGPRNLGLYYYNRGDLATSVKHLLASCTRPDIQPVQLVGTASMFVEANQPDQAEALLLKALPMDRANPETYLMLKMIYDKKGNAVLAQSCLDQARQSIPGLEAERAKQAAAFCREGDKFRAERKFLNAANILWRALLINPDSVAALAGMGHVKLEQGDPDGAATYLNRAIALDPSHAEAHYLLSKLYQRQGKGAEAQREMDRFKESETVAKQKATAAGQ